MRDSVIRSQVIKGPPDLVIEILSDRTRKYDTVVKFHHYEQYGVREYWIVDPREDRIHVHSLHDGSYISLGGFSSGELLETRVLAGLDLDPAEIF